MISRQVGSRGRRERVRARNAVAVALVAMLCVARSFLLIAAVAQAAGSHHPKITSLTLSPSTVGRTGGTVHLHAKVKHAASCRITIAPHLPGFPKTITCGSGHLAVSFHVGANPSAASRHFTLTLKAVRSGHHVTESEHLAQTGRSPTATSFSASPVSLPASGGVTTLTATVSHSGTCDLSVSPAVTGLPAAAACTGTSYSQQVTLPANTSTTAKSYSFSLHVTGPGGASRSLRTQRLRSRALPHRRAVGHRRHRSLSPAFRPRLRRCQVGPTWRQRRLGPQVGPVVRPRRLRRGRHI